MLEDIVENEREKSLPHGAYSLVGQANNKYLHK